MSPASNPILRFCVVIPHLYRDRNSSWLLKTCLDSIEKHEPALRKAVIIVDDASPETDPLYAEYKLTVIKKPKQTSFSDSVNQGMMFAKRRGADVAILMNNDIELLTPLTERISHVFTENEWCSVVGARLFFPDGRVQHDGFEVNDDKSINGYGYGSFEPQTQYQAVMGVTAALSAVHVGRASLLDTAYTLGYEDVDHCIREWEQGRGVILDPEIQAIHHESATRGYRLGQRELESLSRFRAAHFDLPTIRERIRLRNFGED